MTRRRPTVGRRIVTDSRDPQPKTRGATTMPHLRDITDPNRWPLTWALSVVLADPDSQDAWLDLIDTTTNTADQLGCSTEALGYLAAPIDPLDCRWYRARAGHDFGDVDYGRGPVRS